MKRPRFKKILQWTGITLGGLIAVGLIANAVFVWSTDARLESQLAAIREAGDPVTITDLNRPPIPPEQNAATYLRQAAADCKAILEAVPDDNLQGLPEPAFFAVSKNRAKIQKIFDAHPDVFPLIEQAAACPDYDDQRNYDIDDPHVVPTSARDPLQSSLAIARVLLMRARLLTAEGRRDDAANTALLLFRLAEHLEHNSLPVDHLRGMGIRGYAITATNEALQAGPVSPEVRKALDDAPARHERSDVYVRLVKSERALVITAFNTLAPSRNPWFARGFWNREESAALEFFRIYLDLLNDPWAFDKIDSLLRKAVPKNSIPLPTTVSPSSISLPTLMASLTPSMQAGHRFFFKEKAQLRSLRVLNALQARAPKDGATPKLSELGLPPETTVDPFDGQPLRVKKTPRGWLVYSVGPDLADDGGDVNGIEHNRPKDIGVGPPEPPKPAGTSTAPAPTNSAPQPAVYSVAPSAVKP